MGISDRLRDTPTFAPEAPALHYEGSWRPWRYYSEVTTRLDQTLSALGVGKGAPVGLLPRNTPAAVAARSLSWLAAAASSASARSTATARWRRTSGPWT